MSRLGNSRFRASLHRMDIGDTRSGWRHGETIGEDPRVEGTEAMERDKLG